MGWGNCKRHNAPPPLLIIVFVVRVAVRWSEIVLTIVISGGAAAATRGSVRQETDVRTLNVDLAVRDDARQIFEEEEGHAHPPRAGRQGATLCPHVVCSKQ